MYKRLHIECGTRIGIGIKVESVVGTEKEVDVEIEDGIFDSYHFKILKSQ